MTDKLLINGELVDGAGSLEVINPATGQPFASCARAGRKQLEYAATAAQAALPDWSAMSFAARGEKLQALAEQVQTRAGEFSRLLTREQGKPLADAEGEIAGTVAALRVFGGMEIVEQVLKETRAERITRHRSPLGIIAAIAPWNVPLLLMIMKAAPALMTGNAVICKPAPTTPLTTLLFGEIAAEILPPGTLSVITDQNDLGALLASHPLISKVSFTGSTATGKKVMENAAATLKRLVLELGGNDAAIVLDDADPGEAAAGVFQAATFNAGQICYAAKRAYVPEIMYDDFCERLAELARATVVGDGLQAGTRMGPVQNRQQFEKVREYSRIGRTDGQVLTGGNELPGRGYFITPAIVRDIPDNSRLVREEQFGPVLPVLPYRKPDELIARVNDSDYGLGATIWTSDPERAYALGLKVDAGIVWVNKHLDVQFDIPSSGFKQSGLGVENGQEGLESYTQAKIINIAL